MSLLDVAFLLERHPELEAGVGQATDSRTVAAAIRFHFYAARRLRSGAAVPGTLGMRTRWRVGAWLAGRPRAQQVVYDLTIAPIALSREVMERRVGHPLGWGELAIRRLTFVFSRGGRSVARLASPSERSGG